MHPAARESREVRAELFRATSAVDVKTRKACHKTNSPMKCISIIIGEYYKKGNVSVVMDAQYDICVQSFLSTLSVQRKYDF